MRLFIAIELNDEIREYLYKLQKNIGTDLAKINYIAKKNLHLTIKFLGQIKEDKLSELKKLLKEIKYNNFELVISQIGIFPDEYHIKVIWLGFEDENKIKELQRIIDEATINLSKEGIKFGGHITLGRIKNLKNKEKFLKRIKEIKVQKISFKVKKFNLIKSLLSKEGPKYVILEEYILH